MIGKTLGLYLASDFLRRTLFIFLLFFGLIIAVDLIELSKELGKFPGVNFSHILTISLLRAPAFSENILPFATLFGATASLLFLNRRLELVVARASGVSVWQFLFPVLLSAAFLGVFAVLVFNPLSLIAQNASKAAEAAAFDQSNNGGANGKENFWIRLNHQQGDVIIRARVSQQAATKLTAVTAYRFDVNGTIKDRINARHAQFFDDEKGGGRYQLVDATIISSKAKPSHQDTLNIPVNISKNSLISQQTTADTTSFWNLQAQAERAQKAGKTALPFTTRYHALLAQPLLFAAMVLIAATVSLKFVRFGVNGKLILTSICAGFVLYVATKLVITFGSNGLVSPFVAAWTPSIVASLVSVTVLLHQEDG